MSRFCCLTVRWGIRARRPTTSAWQQINHRQDSNLEGFRERGQASIKRARSTSGPRAFDRALALHKNVGWALPTINMGKGGRCPPYLSLHQSEFMCKAPRLDQTRENTWGIREIA